MTGATPTGGEVEPRAWWLAGEDTADLAAQLDGRRPADDPPPPGPGPARLGIVDPDDRRLRLARRLLAEGTPWGGRGDIWFDPRGVARSGGLAFLFPGVEPAFGADAMDVPALARRLGLDAPPIEDDSVPHRAASIIKLGLLLDAAMARLLLRQEGIVGKSL
jgi:hypothetical protein